MSYVIVTDSCCNLPGNIIDELDIKILSLTFIDAEGNQYVSYERGVNKESTLKEFYEKMREGVTFTTSLPKLEDTNKIMKELLEEKKDILYLGFSSGLSGTYQSVSLLMAQLREQYPKRKLIAVDTLAASLGQGMLVYDAAMLKKDGKSIEDVAKWVEDNKQNQAHWFTVSDLVYLFRGGRVSRTSAWAGNLLNIKPVLHVDDEGHLIPMEKVRGRKKSMNALVDHMEKTYLGTKGLGNNIMISHGDCIDDAEYVAKKIYERWLGVNMIINYVDPVIGAHSGPGTLALFFLAKNKN